MRPSSEMEKIFWIPNVSKSYPNCIHVFSNKTGGEKEAKVLKMDNKGQYYAITYTKIKQIYAQKDNTVHRFKPKYNIPHKAPIYAHNLKVVGSNPALSNHSKSRNPKGFLIFYVRGKGGEKEAEVI